MHDVQPIAAATGKALGSMLSAIDAEFKSGTWQSFFGFMAANVGPDIALVTKNFTDLMNMLPGLLTSLQPVARAFLTASDNLVKLSGAATQGFGSLTSLNKTAADINLDSMNILGPTADFVPLGAERSTLKAVVDQVARERGLRVSPDPRPEQGSFYRSDHFPFAKVGVPSISLKEGNDYIGHDKAWGEKKFQEYNQAHYHQPSDEYRDDWNFQGMIQEADFAMEIGRRVANLPTLPKFNPNDEFARRK